MKKRKIVIFSILALISIFLVSFMATDLYIKSKNNSGDSDETSSTINSSNEYLDEDTKVVLEKNGSKEAEKTLKETIDEYGLEGNITQDELTLALAEYGYKFNSVANNIIYYERDSKLGLEPNKYYIGEYEGYIAIYKTDSKGELKIEDEEKDVYTTKFENLPSQDKNSIKNYERVYDTKEEAEYELTGLS